MLRGGTSGGEIGVEKEGTGGEGMGEAGGKSGGVEIERIGGVGRVGRSGGGTGAGVVTTGGETGGVETGSRDGSAGTIEEGWMASRPASGGSHPRGVMSLQRRVHPDQERPAALLLLRTRLRLPSAKCSGMARRRVVLPRARKGQVEGDGAHGLVRAAGRADETRSKPDKTQLGSI